MESVQARFIDTIDRWIAALDRYTLDMLRQAPAPGSWSLGQVYTHIIDDTGYFIMQAKEALSSVTNADRDMHADARRMFRDNSFPDMDIAGPATGKYIPQPESLGQARRALMNIRDDAAGLDLTQGKGKTQHPGLGYFSAAEWLQFAEMHMRHHFRQKQRIDEAIAGGYRKP